MRLPGEAPGPGAGKAADLDRSARSECCYCAGAGLDCLLYYDQIIPGGKLLTFVDTDHVAVAMPIARFHRATTALFINHNDFPREVMIESLLRYLKLDLSVALTEFKVVLD